MTILALHGFTQRGAMWAEVAAEVGGEWLTPDLPGHGAEPPVPWEAAAARLAGLLAVLPRPRILAGYSMGGRLALAVAVAAPDLVDGLVLISAGIVGGGRATGSKGIKDDLINAGATWVDEPAFRDGNIVWGRVVADIPAYLRELMKALTRPTP